MGNWVSQCPTYIYRYTGTFFSTPLIGQVQSANQSGVQVEWVPVSIQKWVELEHFPELRLPRDFEQNQTPYTGDDKENHVYKP